jgi:hypothetical protein
MTLVERLENSDHKEAFLTALEMAERLEGHLLHYEEVIRNHGFDYHMFVIQHVPHRPMQTNGNSRLLMDAKIIEDGVP